MIVGVPREIARDETRVAQVPKTASHLKGLGFQVLVEKDAGLKAGFSNEDYLEAGCQIAQDPKALYSSCDILLKVCPPGRHEPLGCHELEVLKPRSVVVGFLDPLKDLENLELLAQRNVTSFALEFVPRTARAQAMDALSSMATIAGYRAALLAAEHLGKFFPLMMTAAGTVPPARVLVLGAGVAGLQAIATAKRLGARVEAFDVRAAAREQVESLGAQFIEMPLPEEAETAEGYAREMPEDFLQREREVIGQRLALCDAVITTAQVFGRKPPVLITREMLRLMRPGSVVVDLAAEEGGNCEASEPGRLVEVEGIKVLGPRNLPASLPTDASYMLGRNLSSFLAHLFPEAQGPNLEDDIAQATCVTHEGEIVHKAAREALQKGRRTL